MTDHERSELLPATTRTVLLVEDEWLIRMDLALAFENENWIVLEGGTAEEGLQHLADEQQVDLLVSDIRMPGEMTGWDLAIAARRKRETLPVIYISGNAIEQDLMVPGSQFLEKPARAPQVLQLAYRLLGGS